MIKRNASSRDRALKIIYSTNKQKVFSYILSNNGNKDEAKDVYQEAVIAFYERILKNTFKGDSAISTYLYSIARFKWINHLKSSKKRMERNMEFGQTEEFDLGPMSKLIDDEQKASVLRILDALGDQCRKILVESIYYNVSMKEIAAQENYSSEQVVRNKKYKCIQKLKALLAENPALIHILRSYE